MIRTAAAWLNPVSTGELTRLSIHAEPLAPTASCIAPDSSASQTASATHCALPGGASPTSEAPTSTLLSADGPTDSRVELENRTAASIGRKVAYNPVTSGMPASPAYATDCGTMTTATVSAAATSPRNNAASGRGQRRNGNQRDKFDIRRA